MSYDRQSWEQMQKKAPPHDQLIAELLDSRVPKTEREHAAAREIKRLRETLDQSEPLRENQYSADSETYAAFLIGMQQERKASKLIINELLEALENMLQSFLITQSLDDYPIDAPCNKARAAIAKAKGEV